MKPSLPKLLIILVAIAMALTACIPSPTAPTVVPTQPALPASTSVPGAAQPTAIPTLGPATCTAGASAIQPPTAEQAALVAKVPPVNETDLVRGPSDATVTILEYSDYQ